jgi:hypothetical protein
VFEKVVFFPSAIRPPNLARNYIVYIIFYQEKNRQRGETIFLGTVEDPETENGEKQRGQATFSISIP